MGPVQAAAIGRTDIGHDVAVPGTTIVELFHGPTLAFKDVALQLLGRLFEHVLAQRNQHLNILGATSGDTGSAAIEGEVYFTRKKNRFRKVQTLINIRPVEDKKPAAKKAAKKTTKKTEEAKA